MSDDIGDAEVTNTKKASKKAARALAILKKDTGICHSEEVTRILFVCNAGLVTGCSSWELFNIFSKYGPLLQIILIPQKSYSFVVFDTEDCAKIAFDSIHGKVGLNDKGPLYLAFVDQAPKVDNPWENATLPPGLNIIPDFVTQNEESELLQCFNWDEKSTTTERLLKHRQVKHYGYEFSYVTNDIDPETPLEEGIPDLCQAMARRALAAGHTDVEPDQLTVNRYLPGQGIPAHVDTHHCCTRTILSLSLGSGVVMNFKRTETGADSAAVPVWLPPRSLLVMSDEARYAWSHGITPRHYDTLPCRVLDPGHDQADSSLTLVTRDVRVSLTLR